MTSPNEWQIDFILADLENRGLKNDQLRGVMLDHICSIFENDYPETACFEEIYPEIISSFFERELSEIEHQINSSSKFRHHLALTRQAFFGMMFSILLTPFLAVNLLSITRKPSGFFIHIEIWGSSIAYGCFPLLVLLVIWLTPERLDPLIPRNSIVFLGIHPFIAVELC